VTGAPGGTDAAATASPASSPASPLPFIGSANRSDPQAGKFNPANAFGLVCSPGSAAQFWLDRAGASSGRIASSTGEVASEWLSVIVFWALAPASRAAEIELPGIHSAGWPPRSAGHLPMKPLRTASEPAGLTLTTMQRSPIVPDVELKVSANCATELAMDGSATTATVSWPPAHRVAARCERRDS